MRGKSPKVTDFTNDSVVCRPSPHYDYEYMSGATSRPLPENMRIFVGNVYLHAKVDYAGKSTVISKKLYVPISETPEIRLCASGWDDPLLELPQDYVVAGARYYFECPNYPRFLRWRWQVDPTTDGPMLAYGNRSPEFTVSADYGYENLLVAMSGLDLSSCSDSPAVKAYTIIVYISLDFANPSTGTADIRVSHGVPASSSSLMQATSVVDARPSVEQQPYTGAYTLELWDMFRGLVRTVDGSGGLTPFPLHGISPGNYILRLLVDGRQVDSKPLMVR